MDTITFNGKSLSDFGVFWDGSTLFKTPKKDITKYSIPGKSGDLTISNERFNNVTIDIKCFIREDFVNRFSALMNYLYSQNGYIRIENSKENDTYRLGLFVNEIQPNTGAFLKYGNFTLQFDCMPQKWLKSGELVIDLNDYIDSTIVNEYMESKPMFVVGNGNPTIQINNNSISITNSGSGYLCYVDCETLNAYSYDNNNNIINRNVYVTINNNFPTLKSGENKIVITNADSYILDMYPRWWKL